MNININKVKIVTTSPIENVDEILKELGDAGAGIIGNYNYCSMQTNSIGTFMGNDNSNPYIGEKNKLEKVEEIKLEMQCDITKVKEVLKKLREIHPYEEPAIDIIPLIDEKEL
jgi:hypothetical protein